MIYCNKCQWKARLSNIIHKLCANNSNAVFIQTREKIFNDYLPYQEVYKISPLKKYIKLNPFFQIIVRIILFIISLILILFGMYVESVI